MVTVGEAKQIAKDWIEAQAPNIPNFRGAFLTGSINWKTETDPLPSASDVDLKIVVDIDPKDPIFELSRRALYSAQMSCSFDMPGFEKTYKSEELQKDLAIKAYDGLIHAYPEIAKQEEGI